MEVSGSEEMKKDELYCVRIKGTLLYWQNRGGFDLGVQWLTWGDGRRVVEHYRRWANIDAEVYSYYEWQEMDSRAPKKAQRGRLSLDEEE